MKIIRFFAKNSRLPLIISLSLLAILGPVIFLYSQYTKTSLAAWYNSSWSYRKELVFNNATSTTNLTDFPVMIKLTSANFNFSTAQSAGQDIRFTDSDGTTLLSYEFEQYDSGTSTATIWVKVPQINATSTTDSIYMYWGNGSATDAQDADNTWNTSYKGVYHLSDNTTSTTVSDHSGNANHLTASENTNNGFYQASSQIAGSILTAGSPTYITDQTASNIAELYPDIALDSSGFPVIVYYDSTNGNLMLVHCNDKECKGGNETVNTIVSVNDQGAYPTIQLDGSGYPMIAYHDVTGLDLEFVHCNDINCSGGDETFTTIDSTNSTGHFPRMVKDSAGYPVIAYYYATTADLKLAHCADTNCSSSSVNVVDNSANNVGNGYGNIDIVLDGSGYPVISYYDTTATEPKVAHCNDVNCAGSNETISSPLTSLNRSHGSTTAIELDGSGFPMIAYFNTTNLRLDFVHCDDVNCAGDEAANVVTIESNYGDYPNMEKNSSGNPVIIASQARQTPLVYVCSSTSCGTVTSTAIGGANQHNTAHIRFKLDASNNIFGVGYSYGNTALWDVLYFNTSPKLSRTYDSDFDFGTGSFSISTWFKSSDRVLGNTLLSRYDADQGFAVRVNHAGQPCFEIDDDATWGPDDSVCSSDPAISTDVGSINWIYGQDMELDSNNYPVIVYYEGSTQDLGIIHCNDTACAGGDDTPVILDSAGNVGIDHSLILDASGFPVIAYYDTTNTSLKVIHCGNAGCTSGNTTTTVDGATIDDIGRYPTIRLDGSGFPVIAYTDLTNTSVKLMHCNDANCSGANESIFTVANNEDDRLDAGTSSLRLDGSGYPMIVYRDATNLDLKYVHCNDVNCDTATPETFTTLASTGNIGNYASIALDGSGYPVVVTISSPTANGQMTLVHCGNADCSSGNVTNTINTLNGGHTNYQLNLEINSSGYPVIFYTQLSSRSNILTVCNDVNCAGDNETHSIIRGSTNNYYYHSLDLDSNSYPVIGMSHKVRDLDVIHFNNTTTFTESGNYDNEIWHHLVAVKNGVTSITLYLDGVAVATNSALTATGTLTSNSASLNLAESLQNGLSTENWTGYIDEVQIDNTARSSDWVKAQYLSESNNFINVKHTQYGAINTILSSYTNNTGALKNNLIAYYKFDEGYGTTANNSGSVGSSASLNLTGTTPPQWTNNGKLNKGLIFDGVTSRAETTSTALQFASGQFSISLWINPDTLSSAWRRGIIKSETYLTNGYRFGFDNGGYPRFWTNQSGGTLTGPVTTTPMKLNEWNHVAVTYDGTTAKIYLNGKYENSSTGTYVTGNFITIVGSSVSEYFDGTLDDVKFFNAALTADEVKQDYNQKSVISLGSLSDTSALTGGSVASTSASAQYCVPGSSDPCSPPLAEWKFEEGSYTNDCSTNTVFDISSNALHLTSCPASTGPTSKNLGKIGGGIYLDGTDDELRSASTTLELTGAITLESWVKLSSLTNSADPIIINKSNNNSGYGLEIGFSSRIPKFRVGNGTTYSVLSATTTLNDNVWYHVTGRLTSGGVQEIYVNGKLEASTTITGSLATAVGQTFRVGYRSTGQYLNGVIDQVRIYNYARTPAQIAWDYNQGDPVSHYKLDDCTGSTLNDSSGNNNPLTITIGATGSQTTTGTCTTSGAWFNGATGKYASSLNFDGTDDYARDSSYTYDLRDRFTLATWVKSSSMCSASHYLVELEYGKPLLWTGGGGCTANVTMRNSTDTNWNSFTGTTYLTDNTWYHLATTYDTTTGSVKIYVNGKLESTNTHTSQGGTAATSLSIGGRSTVYFPGQLDDVRIYNYALTDAQIKMLYNQSSAVRFNP